MTNHPFLPFLLLIALCANSDRCLGQSIPSSKSPHGQSRSWPAPVRQVQHLELANPAPLNAAPLNAAPLNAVPLNTVPLDAVPVGALPANALRATGAMRMSPPLSPHHVIQPPRPHPSSGKKPIKHPRLHDPHYWSQHHRPIQPAPARLPEANRRETWKSPYSYGYFGASSTRHWNLHNGYRDRYTEWRLR